MLAVRRMGVGIGAALLVSLVHLGLTSPIEARTLTLEERVAAQRAIEEVYWRHRIWPDVNPGPKPALDQVLPDSSIRAKVATSLRGSAALERARRPITDEQLQAEMARMARETRSPEMLAEIFAALGDDPFLIAECLARPLLADRLMSDEVGRGEETGDGAGAAGIVVEASIEISGVNAPVNEAGPLAPAEITLPSSDYSPVAVSPTPACQDDTWTSTATSSLGAFGHAAVWTGSEMFIMGGCSDPGGNPFTGGRRYDPTTNSWSAIPETLPGSVGGCGTTAVWTGTRVIVWGGGYLGDFNSEDWNSGGLYDPGSGTWTSTSAGPNVPGPRHDHTAVWTGSRMIVWGGSHYTNGSGSSTVLGTGGRYDPATDSWAPLSIGLGCSGGTNSGQSCQSNGDCPGTCSGGAIPGESCLPTDGAACAGSCQGNPAVRCTTNIQCQTFGLGNCVPPRGTCVNSGVCQATGYAPTSRAGHSAVWTGGRMIVWGGQSNPPVTTTNTGGRYDPVSDAWTPTSTGTNVPSARSGHTAVWTGSRMIVWGGSGNTGGLYDPTNDSWSPTGTGANVPSARALHTAVWTGSHMIVWGGNAAGGSTNTGGRYDPGLDTWSATGTGTNVPVGRKLHTAVWTGTEMIVWGGQSATGAQPTGGRYCASSACTVATWYRDSDFDGYGNSTDTVLSCAQPAGYAASGGDCNEANAGIHPGAAEPCDGIDNNCDGTVDNAASPAGSAAIDVDPQAGGALLTWTALGGATGYDVVRGSLNTLASSLGDFTAATQACLANDLAATSKSDPGTPAAGQGVWYLIRGVNCGGAGTYDSGAPSQMGSRDAEIQASGAGCP